MAALKSRKDAVLRLADRVVRTYAVAAMLSCGFPGAAALLSSIEEIDDDAKRGRAHAAVAQATSEVLQERASGDGDRALVALVAANEALAMAAAPVPTERHLEELLVAANVAEAASADLPPPISFDDRLDRSG